MNNKKVLITGFEAFAGNETNPTQELVGNLKESSHLKTLVLPVSFSKSWEELEKAIKVFQPDWVISCGVAAKRETIDLERVALNFQDAGIEDNDGYLAQENKISPQFSDCFISDLPLNDWKNTLNEDFPVNVSLSAGSYVCNYIYFNLMAQRMTYQYQSLFIHFPYPNAKLQQSDFERFMERFLRLIG